MCPNSCISRSKREARHNMRASHRFEPGVRRWGGYEERSGGGGPYMHIGIWFQGFGHLLPLFSYHLKVQWQVLRDCGQRSLSQRVCVGGVEAMSSRILRASGWRSAASSEVFNKAIQVVRHDHPRLRRPKVPFPLCGSSVAHSEAAFKCRRH